MKQLMANFGSIIHLDGIYKLLRNGYILVPYLVIDDSGLSKLTAFAVISSEKACIHEAALNALVKANPKDVINGIEFCVVDKSYAELSALSDALPHVHFILCRFHIIEAVRRLSLIHI